MPGLTSWRRERRKILMSLPKDKLKRLKELQVLIKSFSTRGNSRIPLAIHKKNLKNFLAKNGPCTRQEIISKLGIPPGSLSALFKDEDFEQAERGFWFVKS